jgi:hypothetical protein
MFQTLELMRQIKPDFASLSVYEPFPGTQLFDAGLAAGDVTDDRTLEDYCAISPKYYYFADVNNRIDTMTDDRFRHIERSMKSTFHKYNRSPARVFKRARARSALYLNKPGALLGDFRKFLAWLR